MNYFKSSAELKADAREQLLGNYGTLILAAMVIGVMSSVFTLLINLTSSSKALPIFILQLVFTYVSAILSQFLSFSTAKLSLDVSVRRKPELLDVFWAFKNNPIRNLKISFIIGSILYLFSIPQYILAFLLLRNSNVILIGSIMAFYTCFMLVITIYISYSLALTTYLAVDLANLSTMEIIKLSPKLMKGYKGKLFYLSMSFIPIILLGILSCGIGLLWITPYMSVTSANFYLNIMKVHS